MIPSGIKTIVTLYENIQFLARPSELLFEYNFKPI